MSWKSFLISPVLGGCSSSSASRGLSSSITVGCTGAGDLCFSLGCRGSLVAFPPLVVMFFTCSMLVATGNAAASFANLSSTLLLRVYCSSTAVNRKPILLCISFKDDSFVSSLCLTSSIVLVCWAIVSFNESCLKYYLNSYLFYWVDLKCVDICMLSQWPSDLLCTWPSGWYDHASKHDVISSKSSYNHSSFTYTDTSPSHRWTSYTKSCKEATTRGPRATLWGSL